MGRLDIAKEPLRDEYSYYSSKEPYYEDWFCSSGDIDDFIFYDPLMRDLSEDENDGYFRRVSEK